MCSSTNRCAAAASDRFWWRSRASILMLPVSGSCSWPRRAGAYTGTSDSARCLAPNGGWKSQAYLPSLEGSGTPERTQDRVGQGDWLAVQIRGRPSYRRGDNDLPDIGIKGLGKFIGGREDVRRPGRSSHVDVQIVAMMRHDEKCATRPHGCRERGVNCLKKGWRQVHELCRHHVELPRGGIPVADIHTLPADPLGDLTTLSG